MNYSIKIWLVASFALGLSACGGREDLAPVVDYNWRSTTSHAGAAQHVVKRGDTLYAIAFRYDRDYRELAEANHLSSPYSLRVGQVIRIQPHYNNNNHNTIKAARPPMIVQPRRIQPKIIQHRPPVRSFFKQTDDWLWPAHGKIVANFVPSLGKKGVDISGKKGEKIYASKSGIVAYAGSGLVGYGNLIIIRHDKQFLTAYGNNERNLVKEGQFVKAGQVIADMGVVDRRYWGLHFEIRHSGQPVNPLNYLR